MTTIFGHAVEDRMSCVPAHIVADAVLKHLGDGNLQPAPAAVASRLPRRRWTRSEVELLQQRYITTEPVPEIAEALQRTKVSVYSKARRLELKRPFREQKALFSEVPAPTSETITPPALPRARQPIRSKINGSRDVWFDDVCERLERLWWAGFHPETIATVLGSGFTKPSVCSKAHRLGLARRPDPGRLSKNLGEARRIDGEAAPLAAKMQVLREGRVRVLVRRRCDLTGQMFYGERGEHVSPQAKETMWWTGVSRPRNRPSHSRSLQA